MNIFDIIISKYPDIQGVSYWQTQFDGTPWKDPYDGLVWENKDIPKPTKEELLAWSKEASVKAVFESEKVSISRQLEYPPIEKLVEALWEMVIEHRTELASELQLIRESIKSKYPNE